jgi:RNA ligase (TIGR02306 family)
MRKLARIENITNIKNIPNADLIQCAYIGGWPVVIKKDEYSIGDKVIYMEIDSFIPTDLAPFLSKGKEPKEYNGIKGERLRTVKLKGQLSQGLILPLSTISNYDVQHYNIGDDVTNILGIVKYEPPVPACLAGMAKGNFPPFIRKTDEERVQNLNPTMLLDFSNGDYFITEKLDGTSFTCYLYNGVFGVCSRNLDLQETDTNTHWIIAKQYDLENKLRSLNRNIAIQGEIIGDGIQGNHYKLHRNTRELYVFNIFDIDNQQYLDFNDFIDIKNELNVNIVPILNVNKNDLFTCEDYLNYADGKSIINDNVQREGIVVRNVRNDISFKAISNIWLFKYET